MDVSMKDAQGSDGSAEFQLSLHPIRAYDALLVKIQTPRAPSPNLPPVGCSIVLVIDISSSMDFRAVIPGVEQRGAVLQLTVLDLIKHSALTIVKNMTDRDSLGIVLFHEEAETKVTLSSMNSRNKPIAEHVLRNMRTKAGKNIWAGLQAGLELFETAETAGQVPSIMLLSDGVPTRGNPSNGFTNELRDRLPLKASINTFGFGPSVDAGLMASVASIGDGNYTYISDAGMVCTAFAHAMGNLQSTYATGAILRVAFTKYLKISDALRQRRLAFDDNLLTVFLGNIQYGQSRDVVLRVRPTQHKAPPNQVHLVDAKVNLTPVLEGSGQPTSQHSRQSLAAHPGLTANEIAYHVSRACVCSFLAELLDAQGGGDIIVPWKDLATRKKKLSKLLLEIPARKYADSLNQALMSELQGENPAGQVHIAVNSDTHYRRWASHMHRDTEREHKGSAASPARNLNQTRDRTTTTSRGHARTPSIMERTAEGQRAETRDTQVTMASYSGNSACFAHGAPVLLDSGVFIEIERITSGTSVRTLAGPRRVVGLLRTYVENEILCDMSGVLVTAWHPVSFDGMTWYFPVNITTSPLMYTGDVYSILLEADSSPFAHAVQVGGLWGACLGHGITMNEGATEDPRAHPFFGDYVLVCDKMALLRPLNGAYQSYGVVRDRHTGLVNGFRTVKAATDANDGQPYNSASSSGVCA
ncbi:hypothetical protein PWT90_01749 [Aphanocladium album]|nr:hypothetical protein PWT90_01749 [Aphanocladium album]